METLKERKKRLHAEIDFAEKQLVHNLEVLDTSSFLPSSSTILPLITNELFSNSAKITEGLEKGSKIFLKDDNILRVLLKNYSLILKAFKTILS